MTDVNAGSILSPLFGKRVLLLQGPNGPFFARLAKYLRSTGSEVTKVNFNGGDDLFFRGVNVVRFTGSASQWSSSLVALVEQKGIDKVALFGDCRPLHRIAVAECDRLGIDVFVFEEGYLRPCYVTFEQHGVNGHSRLPKDPNFYRRIVPRDLPAPEPVLGAFSAAARHTILYSLASALRVDRYPHYQHHRDLHPVRQAKLWIRGGLRRLRNTRRDRPLDQAIRSGTFEPFFFVPLQVHLDSQLEHSRFKSLDEFIETVVESFAQRAPANVQLVFKHHPLDRPYRDYTELIVGLGEKHGLSARLHYADVIHTPSALRAARGTVTINSTLGLSSIHHGTPVKCLGLAVYDIEGLAYAGDLDEFWRSPGTVDKELYRRFAYFLRSEVLLNGSIWTNVIFGKTSLLGSGTAAVLPPTRVVAKSSTLGRAQESARDA